MVSNRFSVPLHVKGGPKSRNSKLPASRPFCCGHSTINMDNNLCASPLGRGDTWRKMRENLHGTDFGLSGWSPQPPSMSQKCTSPSQVAYHIAVGMVVVEGLRL